MLNHNHVTSSFIVAKCFLSIITAFLIFFAINVRQAINRGVKSHCQRRNICNSLSHWNWCVLIYYGFLKRYQPFAETDIVQVTQRMCTRNKFIATFSSLRFRSEIAVTIRHWVGIVRNCENTVISPNFLVCKFCRKAQVSHSFMWIARNYEQTVPFHKIYIPGN